VFRVPQYIHATENLNVIDSDATPTVVRETPVSAVVDGNDQFGQVCRRLALDRAVGGRDVTHLGRIGE
jgi:LDH2 family malate/lactate/ureidoglycolate dehydrogenase